MQQSTSRGTQARETWMWKWTYAGCQKHRACWTSQPSCRRGGPTRFSPSQGALHGGQPPCHPARPPGPSWLGPRPEHPHPPRDGDRGGDGGRGGERSPLPHEEGRGWAGGPHWAAGPRANGCEAAADHHAGGVGQAGQAGQYGSGRRRSGGSPIHLLSITPYILEESYSH